MFLENVEYIIFLYIIFQRAIWHTSANRKNARKSYVTTVSTIALMKLICVKELLMKLARLQIFELVIETFD